jgi:hypothetical protein
MSHGGGGNAFGPIWWLVGAIIVLWVVWYIIGGPEHANKDKPFMDAPSPVGSGEVYGPSGPQHSIQTTTESELEPL